MQANKTDTRPTGEFLQYGGQAVIEGVMMRSPRYFAVACRKPDGEIITQCEEVDKSALRKLKWLNKPFLRGTLALLDAMVLGNRALSFASRIQLEAVQEEENYGKYVKIGNREQGTGNGDVPIPDTEHPTPNTQTLNIRTPEHPNADHHAPTPLETDAASIAGGPPMIVTTKAPQSNRINDIAVVGTIVVSLIFGIVLFRIVPTLLTEGAERMGWLGSAPGRYALNAFDGLIRACMFFGYILLISRMAGIRAVFQYHGAEHKAINTLEAGQPLTRENALRASRIHPRCGTSFIIVVMVVDFLLCLMLPRPDWWWRIPLHMAVLPPVAGIAYEVIKFAGKYRSSPLVMAAFAPGMWSQYLTTREPTPEQVNVALASLYAVLDAEGHRHYIPGEVIPPAAPDPDEPAAVTV